MHYVEEFGPKSEYRRSVLFDTETEARHRMIIMISEVFPGLRYENVLDQIGDYGRALQAAAWETMAHAWTGSQSYTWVLMEEGN